MKVYAFDHVQLAMPPNEENRARAFYSGVLGLMEVPKPANLAPNGGVWFEQEQIKIHLGIEQDFRPAKKAHPALLVENLDMLIKHCQRSGYPTVEAEPIEGYHRFHVFDPFGNRIELMEKLL